MTPLSQSIEILLVEDTAADATLIIRTLRKYHLADKVFHVKDGAEALDYLYARGNYSNQTSACLPKLILLDLKLPKVDGLEVLRHLKENEETRTIPVVILTSSREQKDLAQSYQLGVNSYVVKPVEFESFTKTVENLGLYWLSLNEYLEK